MPHVEVDVETSLTPDQVVQALTDFSDRRPEIWPGIAPELYEVYSVGDRTAEIKEGTSAPGLKIWAREHYDWSEPGTVAWTVMESNFSTPGSGVVARMEPLPDGKTRIHITWERTGSTLKGRFLCRMIKLTNGKPIAASVRKGLARLEEAQARSK